jgi:hypothetical protein
MDSLLANLFLALQTRIASAIPAIRGIYPELSQTENYRGIPAFWPCLFIDFRNFNYAEMLQNAQAASGELQIRFVYPVMNVSGISFIDNNTALGYYDIEMRIHQLLQGWTNGSFMPLSRLSVTTEVREDTFRGRVLTYSLQFNETTDPAATRTVKRPPLNVVE